MRSSKIKIGDRVEILVGGIFHLKHRNRPWFGFVNSIDGEDLLVRPTWCKWEIHLYTNEVRKPNAG